MQICTVGSRRMGVAMARRLAMLRDGVGGHAVEARDPKP
jgi:hypothetical protein